MLKDTLKKDLITAMKAKDLLKVSVLRYLLSKVGEREIELRTEEKEITEEDIAKNYKEAYKTAWSVY